MRDQRTPLQGCQPSGVPLPIGRILASTPFASGRHYIPTDCIMATRLPAATPPPLAMADADIILEAMDAGAIPAPVNPNTPATTGKAAVAAVVQETQY